MVTVGLSRGSFRRAGSRAVATFVDEGLSSLQNFVVLFAALHYLSVSGIGAFTLAYTGALLIESVLKSLLLEPLTIRFSTAQRDVHRAAASGALGASLAFGLACSVLATVISAPLNNSDGMLVLATGLAVPSLIVQEAWRVYFFTTANPWKAALNDGVCLGVTLLLVWFFVVRQDSASPSSLIFLLSAGTAIGILVGVVQARLCPSVRRAWPWARTHWYLGSRLAGGNTVGQGAGRVSLAIVGVISGSAALGQFAASRTLVTPATTMMTSAVTFAVPEAVRLIGRGRRDHLTWFLVGLSAVLAGAVSVFGLALYLVPANVGAVIAGSNWDVAKSLLFPVVVWAAAVALRQGPRVGLRAFECPATILRLSIVTAVAIVTATAIGSIAAGAVGAAWAFALVHMATSVLWWSSYRRVARTEPRVAVEPR